MSATLCLTSVKVYFLTSRDVDSTCNEKYFHQEKKKILEDNEPLK
jgi:hypothetical protein